MLRHTLFKNKPLYSTLARRAKLAINFFVPCSKAISSSTSLPIGVALMTSPFPKGFMLHHIAGFKLHSRFWPEVLPGQNAWPLLRISFEALFPLPASWFPDPAFSSPALGFYLIKSKGISRLNREGRFRLVEPKSIRLSAFSR